MRTCTLVSESDDPAADCDLQVHASKKKLTLRAPNIDEKSCWKKMLMPFNNVVATIEAGGSIPIASVMGAGILACIDALSRDGCVPGIFRENGKSDEVKSLFQAFVRGARTIPSGADVHAVAGCCKKLLRELPETIFTNKLFEQVVASNPNPTKVRRGRTDKENG